MFDVFSVLGLEDKENFFTRQFLEVFCFTSASAVKTESVEEGFLRSLVSNSVFPVIWN